ncbi:MAG: hypothetical protein Kow00121_06740 [Elainellaceae cyanobacterium]
MQIFRSLHTARYGKPTSLDAIQKTKNALSDDLMQSNDRKVQTTIVAKALARTKDT